jgi:hypothetical protein
MAVVNLTVQDVARSGLNLTGAKTTVVVANDYYFPNDGRTKLFVNNIAATGNTVTIETPNTVDGAAIADKTVAQLTLEKHLIGPFPQNFYNNGDGNMHVTFSAIVEIVAVRM